MKLRNTRARAGGQTKRGSVRWATGLAGGEQQGRHAGRTHNAEVEDFQSVVYFVKKVERNCTRVRTAKENCFVKGRGAVRDTLLSQLGRNISL